MNPSFADPWREIGRIEDAARRVLGHSAAAGEILRICAMARADLEDIMSRRGVSARVICVMGHKNAGKSTLCRWLLRREEDRERIDAGMGAGERHATLKVSWIGPEAPGVLAGDEECVVPVAAADLEDLGMSYVLVDVPGFTDSHAGASRAAAHAYRMAEHVVFVSEWDQMESEAPLVQLAHCNGARVLPVVVAGDGRMAADAETREELASHRRRLQRRLPGSVVCEPVLVPMLDLARSEEELRRRQDEGRARFLGGLRTLLGSPPPSPLLLAQTRHEVFRREVGRLLGGMEWVGRVRVRHERVVESEHEVVKQIAEALTGTPEQLTAAVRLRLMARLVEECPAVFFPFRSFLSLLTLMAGAWDRLILGFLGSLPSLAMSVVQSGRNARSLVSQRRDLRGRLEKRAKALAGEKLAPAHEAFVHALRDSLPDGAGGAMAELPGEPRLAGLDEAEAAAGECFAAGLRSEAGGRWLCLVLGGVSLVLWLGLAAGPVWAVYQEFFAAWNHSLEVARDASWRRFPAPSGGMFLSTLLLVFSPVFLLAMITLALTVTRRRCQRRAKAILRETNESIRKLAEGGVLRLRQDDPLREAVGVLLEVAISAPAAPPRRGEGP
jgi:hypothetical protein